MADSVQQGQIAVLRTFGGLSFDATFEEAHESELIVTDNPVETGVVVSDHAYMAPLKLTIVAGVSDTPMRQTDTDAFASDATGRSRRAYALLQELQKTAEPFSVQTGLRLYANMVCVSIRTQQDKDSAGTFVFTATLREIIITFTKSVSYPARKSGTTARQASATKQRGEQQSTEASKREVSSFGRDVFDGIKRLF